MIDTRDATDRSYVDGERVVYGSRYLELYAKELVRKHRHEPGHRAQYLGYALSLSNSGHHSLRPIAKCAACPHGVFETSLAI